MTPRTARQTDRFSQFALAAGRLAMTDAGLKVGARAAMHDADRVAVYVGSALGGIAYAEVAARALPGARHPRRGPEPGAGRVRRRGAGQPGHRAGPPRPHPVDGQLVRRRRGGTGRGLPADPRRRRGRGTGRRRGSAADRRSRSGRSTSSGRSARATTTRRPAPRGRSTSDRDGFVMGEAAALLRARGGGRGAAPRRDALRRAARLRRHERRVPHGPAAAGRSPGGPRRAHRAGRWRRSRPPRSTTSTRTRRPRRSATASRPLAIARALGPRARTRAGQRHQGVLRPPAGCVGRDRSRDLRRSPSAAAGRPARST